MGKFSWAPWMGMDELNEMVKRMAREQNARTCSERYLWTPAADMMETQRNFRIEVELPGLTLKQVAVEFRGEDLWVYGERQREKGAQGNVYHAMERECGPFARRFSLPRDVDSSSITATLRDGILTVTIPKKTAQPRRRILVD